MRIVVDGQPLLVTLAGVGHYTRQLVRAVARLDPRHRYTLLMPRPMRIWSRRRMRTPTFAEPNVDVALAGWTASLRARMARRLGRPISLGRVVDHPPGDVFHAPNNVFPYRLRARRHVLTVHDVTLCLFPEWHPPRRLAEMAPLVRPSIMGADHVITPSEATRTDVLKLLPIDPERVSVIPHGVDPAFAPRSVAEIEAGVAPFGLRRGEYLLSLATVEPRKNVLRTLEALERTPPEVGPLAVAGGPGWNDVDIVAALARLEAAGRVRRLGYVPDEARPALIGGARAFVYPSLYEGFGLPPLDALACGTPVLTSNVSSLPEVVGDAAILVDPRDVRAIADGLVRLWHDDGLRGELRARGLARAREFSWERTARLTLAVYERVLDS